MRQNTKISAADSLGQHERKQHELRFDESVKKFLHERKQAKLQWLQDPSQINVHNVNNTSVKQVNISGTEGTSDR
jgi:hypothetical protein